MIGDQANQILRGLSKRKSKGYEFESVYEIQEIREFPRSRQF